LDDGIHHVFDQHATVKGLGTRLIGRKIYIHDQVTSTNDLAHRLAAEGVEAGAVVFAKEQTKGRGRWGKAWASPRGKGLYFSCLLRPLWTPQEVTRLTVATAWAVAAAMRESLDEGVSVKWPNDVLANGKKISGILTEMSLNGAAVDHVVVGVGVNVNADASDLPPEATSLKIELGRSIDMDDLAHALLKRIDANIQLIEQGRFAFILAKIREHSALKLGGRVKITTQDREVEGYAIDFDDQGWLVVRLDNGFMEHISSGHLETMD
jgi:BirA family biotin operon repressor/biotin-[acetyl-CoA-carboxylase] ligase